MRYMTIFNVILAVLGIYLSYAAVQMKRTGQICAILLSDEERNSCTDAQGFIDGIYRQTLLFGMIMLLFGVADGINGVIGFFGRTFSIIVSVVFLISCLWFFSVTRRVKEKFIR